MRKKNSCIKATINKTRKTNSNCHTRAKTISRLTTNKTWKNSQKGQHHAKGMLKIILIKISINNDNYQWLKMEMGIIECDSSSPESEPRDVEAFRLKRGHVLAELVETERVYVAELGSIIKGYKLEMTCETMINLVPAALVGKADVLFGNLEEIYHFHGETFLRDLENCISNTELVALCFVQRRDIFFRLYSYYCQNIPRSERLRQQIHTEPQFLATCQQKLGHKLPLAAYLLKPVQRITKYQLLLKDLLKYSDEPACCTELQEALDCMLVVLKCVNDSMHQTAITGFGV